jgi:hypothetical protein
MSTSTPKPTKAAVLAQVQALMAGIEKHFPNGSFTFENTAYTTATLIQALQSLANAISDTNAARARDREAVLTLKGIATRMAPLLRDIKRFVLMTYSTSPQMLADFGVPPPKARTPLTSEQKAAATAKMRATRAARGTTSKKHKLAVKGDVTSVTPLVRRATSWCLPGHAPPEWRPPARVRGRL